MSGFIVKIRELFAWLCIFVTFPSFAFSFSAMKYSRDFSFSCNGMGEQSIYLNGEYSEALLSGACSFDDGRMKINGESTITFKNGDCDWFNYYGISYSSDAYLKGTITYLQLGEERSEDFFLEASETDADFYCLLDDYFAGKKANKIISVSLAPLDKAAACVEINGICTFNRRIEDRTLFVKNKHLKIGVDLEWGGGLSYLEDLDSNVEAVKLDGKIKVDSNASKRYSTRAVSKSVNLLNNYDTGRLVQQSYYGRGDENYVPGTYMDSVWNYNPVQGGNKFNEKSKIVDFRQESNRIYVKCRALDWAKEKEYITPSYMEAEYILEGNKLNVKCRFTDFSGFLPYAREQEMPAFYCIEPLNKFYYAHEGEIVCEPDLIFWHDAGYPKFVSDEGWAAFAGEFEDSFGIGIYMPGEQTFLSGVFDRGNTVSAEPCTSASTSYTAILKTVGFSSFAPMEYSYSICTGSVSEIRGAFLHNEG